MEVFFATLLLLSVHFCLHHFKESPNKWLNTHFTAYLVLNGFFFALWLDLGKGNPWFMFVGLFLTYTLGLHFISHAQFPDKGWSTHVLSFGILNTFFFLTWATTGNIKLVACVNLFRNGIPMVFLPIGNLVNLTHFPCHNEEQSCSKATTVACSNSYRSCQPSNERNSYNCKCPQHHSHSSCSD